MPKTEIISDVVERAMENWKLANDAESSWREECLDDLNFSIGDQWPMNIRTQRERDGRPCLTMDQMGQSIRLVCNEYRQKPPGVQVDPIGNGADTETAEIFQGCIRHIENISNATVAYEWAHESVVRVGIGHWRILNDYSASEGEEQEIYVVPIRNMFSVYWQPGVPYEKAEWAFIVEDVPLNAYKKSYPDSWLAKDSQYQGAGNETPDWQDATYIRVAEYFEMVEVKGQRKKEVRWWKINGREILEGGEDGERCPGSSIPIITAVGNDIDVDGRRHLSGLVRNGKDAQRQYNFIVTAMTERLALEPKAPWIAPVGTLVNENMWETANTRNWQVLYYKLTDVAGKPAPAPTRNVTEAPVGGYAQLLAQAGMDLKAALGIWDPSLGQNKGDQSGKAIERLQQQGNTSTLNYSDNVARAMQRHGKLLLEWIRDIYTEAKVQRIINPDGSPKMVIVHQQDENAAKEVQAENQDIQNIYDIGVGDYDVTISVGPSYQSKRKEAVETQLELLKLMPPQQAVAVLPMLITNMDIPQAKQIAEQIKKTLPPNLQDQDDGSPEQQVQKLQQQLAQAMQQHDLLVKVNEEMKQVIQTKQIEQQGKMQVTQVQQQGALQKAKLDSDTKIAVAEITTMQQQLQQRIDALLQVYQDTHNAAHETALDAAQKQHEQQMAVSQQQADQQSQQTDIGAQQEAQASDQSHELTTTALGQSHEQKMAKESAKTAAKEK